MKWEYMPHYSFRLSKDQLNELGNDGWELVSHFIFVEPHEDRHEYIFKRPKQKTPEPPTEPQRDKPDFPFFDPEP